MASSPSLTRRPGGVHRVGALAPVGVKERALGKWSKAAQQREHRHDAKNAESPAEDARKDLATLDDAPTALDDGGRESVAIGLVARERVAFFDEGAARHEVLAPGDESDAKEKQTDAHRRGDDPGLRVHHVGGAKAGHRKDAQDEADRDDQFDGVGVLRCGLQVRVVRAQSRDRHGRVRVQ